jgi:hypothetical protein
MLSDETIYRRWLDVLAHPKITEPTVSPPLTVTMTFICQIAFFLDHRGFEDPSPGLPVDV